MKLNVVFTFLVRNGWKQGNNYEMIFLKNIFFNRLMEMMKLSFDVRNIFQIKYFPVIE